MARSLTRSNAHFRKAVTRLPLGVSSNFRYWGEDKTIYVAGAKGARLRDIDGNEYIDYRMAYGPCILGYADPRVDAAAKAGIEMGGVFALSTEREYAVAEPDCEDGAGCRARAVLEFRDGGSHGRAPPRARLHRQGLLRGRRGWLSRRIRRCALVHADRGLEAFLRRSATRALQRRRPEHSARPAARGADERRRPPRELSSRLTGTRSRLS
jgi:hypothetical protein